MGNHVLRRPREAATASLTRSLAGRQLAKGAQEVLSLSLSLSPRPHSFKSHPGDLLPLWGGSWPLLPSRQWWSEEGAPLLAPCSSLLEQPWKGPIKQPERAAPWVCGWQVASPPSCIVSWQFSSHLKVSWFPFLFFLSLSFSLSFPSSGSRSFEPHALNLPSTKSFNEPKRTAFSTT